MAGRAKRRRRLWDAYCFPSFRPQPTVCGVFGDPIARVIRLTRRSKKRLMAVAAEWKMDWHTVKVLDQQYREAQLKRAGTPSPRVIGIDEIAIRKGHTYRIVVSDLLRGRPIWFGGKDRSEASLGEFYAFIG